MQYNLVLRFLECLNLMVAFHLATGLYVTNAYQNAYFALGSGKDPATLPAVNYPFKIILTGTGKDTREIMNSLLTFSCRDELLVM